MPEFLFDKNVDQSLLKSGLTVPKDQQDKLLKSISSHLEKGETIEECAIRETEEETGRTCRLVDNTPVDILKYSTPRGENVENYMYLAIDTGKSERDILEKDKERVVWVKPKDVEKTLTYTDLKEFWNKVKGKVEEIIEEK